MEKPINYKQLIKKLHTWAHELGFQQLGITDTQLDSHETFLLNWLDKGFHGDMDYMQRHGTLRSRPHELINNTIRIISVRMDYYPPDSTTPSTVLNDKTQGYISRYALGRDYHKVMRKKLQKLATLMQEEIGEFGYRAFVDSAPVLEKALAEKAGLGWIGKHSNLINRKAGSWFFLGEIYVDIPLPIDPPNESNHCGKCTACIDVCPTNAIIAPYKVDARRCISYLTIELKTSIPVEFRKAMGNLIYGCDDCQLVCPWNRFSKDSEENDFRIRHQLDKPDLLSLFAWDEATFLKNTEGSAIRRIGHQQWLRNIAIALGNAPSNTAIIQALKAKHQEAGDMLKEHIEWALEQHQ